MIFNKSGAYLSRRLSNPDESLLILYDVDGLHLKEGATMAGAVRLVEEKNRSILHPFRTLEGIRKKRRLEEHWREIKRGASVYDGADQHLALLHEAAEVLEGEPTEYLDDAAPEIVRGNMHPHSDELLRVSVAAENAETKLLSTGTEKTFLRPFEEWYGVETVGPELERRRVDEGVEVFGSRFTGSYGDIDPTSELQRTDWGAAKAADIVARAQPDIVCNVGHSSRDIEKMDYVRDMEPWLVNIGVAPQVPSREEYDAHASGHGDLAYFLTHVFSYRNQRASQPGR